ncbi:MAG: translation initiation factor 2 [Desulfotomaculaceae bacterium]|nr:translation initiation factor 2 [Desulfotomaculaceae bacterium]
MKEAAEIPYLKIRIRELEERVEQLRLSRRVLMSLIEKVEKDKVKYLCRLEKENRKLHQDNYRYAVSLLCKNRQIVELKSKLGDSPSRN